MKVEVRFNISEEVKKDMLCGGRNRSGFSCGLGEWMITIDFSAGVPYCTEVEIFTV